MSAASPLVLGLGAAGFRRGPPWRLVDDGGRDGRRCWPASASSRARSGGSAGSPSLPRLSGRTIPWSTLPRTDAYVLDMAGSPYELLAALLPGFGLFRYPAKLLTLTAVALSALAGLGWDELVAGRSKRFARGFLLGVAASGVALVLATALRGRAVAFLSARSVTLFDTGPLDAAQCLAGNAAGARARPGRLRRSAWCWRSGDRAGRAWAGAVALVVVAADLALAGSRMIWTVPQADFDITPEIARQIEESERADPAPGPFRIHRMSAWHPHRFLEPSEPGAGPRAFGWYRETMRP